MAKNRKAPPSFLTRVPSSKPNKALVMTNEQVLGLKNIGLQKTLLDVQAQQGMNQIMTERSAWATQVCEDHGLSINPAKLFDLYDFNVETKQMTLKPEPEAATPPAVEEAKASEKTA